MNDKNTPQLKDKNNTQRPQLEDYERALESMGTYIDVSANDAMDLADRAALFARHRVTESVSVSQIMSAPVKTVRSDALMSEAAHLMVSERISGLPVIDDEEHVVGILTEADFLRGFGLPAHYPAHNIWQTLEAMFSHLSFQASLEGPEDSVSDHMVRDVVCAAAADNVLDVLDLMKRHWIKRVLVCDHDRRLLGIVTRSDLVRVFFDRYKRGRER